MYFWNVKEISPNEYHVIETRYVNEPDFVLAKCSGPVPAGDIVNAMRIAQAIQLGKDSINNSLTSIKRSMELFLAECEK
jgi:hypothetical protein